MHDKEEPMAQQGGIAFKKYEAIFFDWDGTAVLSRSAPAGEVIAKMTRLLAQGVILVIISGTTYDNIAEGKIHEMIPKEHLKNLFLGLGRGAVTYGFDENGAAVVLHDTLPRFEDNLKLHQVVFKVHRYLFENHRYETDIIFSRPNYCKIDLLVDRDRKDQLFLNSDEPLMIKEKLIKHGYMNGIRGLIDLAANIGHEYGMRLKATSDAKYLEIGMSTKSDNVDWLMENVVFKRGIKAEKCAFWGDEYTYICEGVKGSDAFMVTAKTKNADFFDVSHAPLALPEGICHLGGGIKTFSSFLDSQTA